MSDVRPDVLRDVRLLGFANRTSVGEAIGWIDSHSKPLGDEEVFIETAVGRVLAKPFVSPRHSPLTDTATTDGYALRSSETIGADPYNPIVFCTQADPSVPAHCSVLQHSATLVSSGTALPEGTDAIAPFDLVRVGTTTVDLIGTVARGVGVSLRSQEASEDTHLIHNSRPLRPSDLGLISSFGVARIAVVRSPIVRLILAGRKPSSDRELDDANGPMLRALIARDGGMVESSVYSLSGQAAIADFISQPGADLVLVCGRTGTGTDDVSPLALAAVGTLSIHGIAFVPGGSAAMGSVGRVPVILLPGSPLDCLCAYDLLAGRLLRRLAGLRSQLPYHIRLATVGRKIVSSVGNVEFCRVRIVSGEAIPLGSPDSGGFVSVARADGFVLVPAALEGYAPGASVAVHMYDDADSVEDTRL